jgi:hypothetical protein
MVLGKSPPIGREKAGGMSFDVGFEQGARSKNESQRREQEEEMVNPEEETGATALPHKMDTLLPKSTQEQGGSVETVELLLMYQSLLAQFSNTQVRADFVNGKFSRSVNPHLLPQLDELRWCLFPRWQGGSLEFPNPAIKAARVHAEKLFTRSKDVAATSIEAMNDGISYEDWFQILQSIATDRYWMDTPADQRCTHIESNNHLGAERTDNGRRHGTGKAAALLKSEDTGSFEIKPSNYYYYRV